MHNSEGVFQTRDGLRLFEARWYPETEPKGKVVIVHGYAEHSGRHVHTAERLKHHEYAVYAFDLRGHGRSEGIRTFVRSFDEYVTDAELFLEHIESDKSDKPIFLLGHSLGGTIATFLAIESHTRLHGLVLSSPFLKIPDNFSSSMQILISFVGRVSPRLRLVRKLDPHLLSRDPEVAASYENDPLVYHGWIPSRTASEIKTAVNRIRSKMEDVSLPLLILHGTSDRLAEPDGSKELYRRARSNDKTLKLYDGLYHELFNEPEREDVLKALTEWLDAHL